MYAEIMDSVTLNDQNFTTNIDNVEHLEIHYNFTVIKVVTFKVLLCLLVVLN